MSASSALPAVRPWEERFQSAYWMPGGFSRYLETLKSICSVVEQNQLSKRDLIYQLESRLGITHKNGTYVVSFLLRTDLLQATEFFSVGPWTRRWLDNGDEGIVIALLHSRVQFIGEMLAELRRMPRSTRELLSIANDNYGFRWKAEPQISARRGWLQSAGFIKIDVDKKLAITDSGLALLARLDVASPSPESTPHSEPALELPHGPVSPSGHLARPSLVDEPGPPQGPARSHELATEIEESSIDSQDPDRFELAVRDAFAFLGFHAEHLGGSGRTDVLLAARLGPSDSYKVTVDAKTTASGQVRDHQVDWATLAEHRTNEGAEHSLLVGPDPRGNRLFKRAVANKVTVLPARQLAELCGSHAQAPLGLDDYRVLFSTPGKADLTELRNRADRSKELRGLAADICSMLAERGASIGYHRARDLWMLQPHTATKDEFQSVLNALASPLVGAVHGDPEKGYVLSTDPKVAQLRLILLGEELTSPDPTP